MDRIAPVVRFMRQGYTTASLRAAALLTNSNDPSASFALKDGGAGFRLEMQKTCAGCSGRRATEEASASSYPNDGVLLSAAWRRRWWWRQGGLCELAVELGGYVARVLFAGSGFGILRLPERPAGSLITVVVPPSEKTSPMFRAIVLAGAALTACGSDGATVSNAGTDAAGAADTSSQDAAPDVTTDAGSPVTDADLVTDAKDDFPLIK
jgi:hypothetical protein